MITWSRSFGSATLPLLIVVEMKVISKYPVPIINELLNELTGARSQMVLET
jgi:hypothetical protein